MEEMGVSVNGVVYHLVWSIFFHLIYGGEGSRVEIRY